MKISSLNKVGMFATVASWPVMPRFARYLVNTTPLTNLEGAVIAVTKWSLSVPETTLFQIIFNFIQHIHFLRMLVSLSFGLILPFLINSAFELAAASVL